MKMARPVPSHSNTLQLVRLRLTNRYRSPDSGSAFNDDRI